MRMRRLAVYSSVLISSLVVGIAMGHAACRKVGVPCAGWGAGSTQAQQTGFCCVSQTSASVPCSAGQIKSVNDQTSGCGQLRAVESGNCGATDAGPCALFEGRAGCTTENCGS
jgi:hypothetical protein